MATLRKINGNYYAYFYNRLRTPKRKSWPLRVSRKGAARRKLTRLEKLYEADEFDPWNPESAPGMVTVKEAVSEFIESKQHLRPKSIEAYEYVLDDLVDRLPPNLMMAHLETDHIAPLVDDTSVSIGTRRHRFRHLRTFINWADEKGYVDSRILDDVNVPKEEKRVPEFLTPKQLQEVLDKIDEDFEAKRKKGFARDGEITWLKDMIILAVGTGLRLSALTWLHWSDVDLETGFLTVRHRGDFRPKSGHERSVPLVGDALAVVKRRWEERDEDSDGPVLTYPDGGQIVPGYASKRFKKYVRLAGLSERFRFHSLRHTCASWLVQQGISLPIVAEILGHSGIDVTKKYAHLAPDVMQAAMKRTFGE